MADVSPGEVVWAKIKGYAWWPAVVSPIQVSRKKQRKGQESLIRVSFVGEDT